MHVKWNCHYINWMVMTYKSLLHVDKGNNLFSDQEPVNYK
jgi:hypothetical protein